MKKLLSVSLILLLALAVAPLMAQDEEADQAEQEEMSKMNAGTFASLSLRNIGPALMSGRIIDIAIHPEDKSTWYVAVASGNVWKTTNAGTTWRPIFDNYGSYSIGCVTIDPNNPNVIWVGTGENNSQRSVGYGDGVYKSVDGGKSFKNVGLKESEHIGMITIDPRDSNVVYVAAQGPLWNAGGDRGLYKTTDGGENWELIADFGEHTGANEVYLDPRNPDIVYTTSYQRRRHTWVLINGGPESGVHKSFDGGETWKEINRGLPGGDKGKIGLAMSPQNPDVLYAIVEADPSVEGFFRTEDGGETWQRMSGYVSGSPQYYNEIMTSPHKFDRVYSMDTYLQYTDDGGKTWNNIQKNTMHVDNHAIAFDPDMPDYFIVGNDGGLYETWDHGETYKFHANLPVTQFYKVAVDNREPFYYVYGGTQDNNTQGGPSQTDAVQGIRNSDWFITVGGDGFDPAVDPENPDIVYSQWQYGGLVRYDHANGETIDIRPMPKPDWAPDRWNWDSALMISPHSPSRLYYASQRLYRSEDRGDTWVGLADGKDLTRDLDRNKLEVMGRVWSVDAVAKNNSTSPYGNIVAVTESPVQEDLLYVGTDDGLIQMSEDGGATWTKYESFPDVPDMSYINDLEADLFDANTVYAAINNHKRGDFKPYVLKSTDKGATWTSISGNLPERGSVYAVKQDHENKDLLFAGTEFGVFFTQDGGENWIQLKGGMPTIAIRDIEIQRRENDLVLASFGRGFFILDDYTPLRTASDEVFEQEAHMFPIEKALSYVPRRILGWGEKGSQGDAYFTAPNPPFGATFTFYMKESMMTLEQQRQKEEAKLKREGEDTPYPGWDELKAEDREEQPALIVTVKDTEGNVVRRMTAPPRAGIHRVTWDLRYPSMTPTSLRNSWFNVGPLAVPGTYTVSVAKRQLDETEQIIDEQEFVVEPLGFSSLPQKDREEILAFQKEVGELQRSFMGAQRVLSDVENRMTYIKKAILDTPRADEALYDEARELELKLMDLQERLNGDPTKPRRSEPEKPSLSNRLRTATGSWGTTYGPTTTHKRQYEIVAEEFNTLLSELRTFVEEELPAFEQKLEDAGAPWTPGRAIPSWNK